MDPKTPKQAFAARDAHEALRELKKMVDEAAKITHEAELESFHLAFHHNQTDSVRRSLQIANECLKSVDFDKAVFTVREKLETALSF